MKSSPNAANSKRRAIVVWSALALTVLAAVWPVPQQPAGAPAAATADAQTVAGADRAPAAMPAPDFAPIARTTPEPAPAGKVSDLFPVQSWLPPPPPPSLQDSKPVAPPLPFTYGGSYREGSAVRIFVKDGDNLLPIRQGDIVRGAYRVDEIGAAMITFTYLPMNLRQDLPLTGVLP